jgi:hypothetical protein
MQTPNKAAKVSPYAIGSRAVNRAQHQKMPLKIANKRFYTASSKVKISFLRALN